MVRIAPDCEFVFFLDPASASRFELHHENVREVRVTQSRAPTVAASADGNRSPLDMLRMTRAVWRETIDVFFYPSVYTYFPLPPGRRAVVGIHDAIAERFASRTLPSTRARLFWNTKVRMAVGQATLVLTVSDFAADDIARVIGVPRARIRVAVEAPAAAFRPIDSAEAVRTSARRVGLPDGARWFTYVGGFSPHKNLDVLVRAFAAALDRGADDVLAPVYLVLAGKLTGDAFHVSVEAVREAVTAYGLEDRVIFPGFVVDEELRHLHAGALALVLPSDCEGFGLPAVEAAACGAPVIATTESPLPQLLAGGGIFVEPRDEQALAHAMRTMLRDEEGRRVMASMALERAGALSWRKCAVDALAAIREAAA
jgi:glycosyltransferase involved in cell wall biosynthesis